MLRSSRLWFSRSIRSSSAILACRCFDNSARLGMLMQLVWRGYLQQAALHSHESCSKHGKGTSKGYWYLLMNLKQNRDLRGVWFFARIKCKRQRVNGDCQPIGFLGSARLQLKF
jgi:hypothetical protein